MRQPTPSEKAYEWHRRRLAGERVLTSENEPQCGYFRRRYGRKNDKAYDWLPASIYLESHVDADGELTGPEILRCEIAGVQKNPGEEWTWLAGNPISRVEYLSMVAAMAEF